MVKIFTLFIITRRIFLGDNNNHQITNGNNKYNHHEKVNGKARKEVIIIGDFMLNNINSRGLSKSKKMEVLNFPGATSSEIVGKMMMF